MAFITKASEIPSDEPFHTVTVEEQEDGYYIAASNNDVFCYGSVGSVGIDGTSAGIKGEATFEAAGEQMFVHYIDFTEEHGYDEIQLEFGQQN